jgi:hypothetical protein
MAFFVEKRHKNHDYPASLRSLQSKKSPARRFFETLCAKRNKLLDKKNSKKSKKFQFD